MGKTTIEWTDASWNPIVGCTEVSPGCANCYAARLAATRLKNHADYKGLTFFHGSNVPGREAPWRPHWTGEVRFLPKRLEEPLHWRKPRRIFVCDMGDLFHEGVHGDWIDRVLAMIYRCPQHTFQILTKRAQRMHDCMRLYQLMKNVWLGVSVENQHFADERIPALLATPAAVRFVSAEPLLGPVDLDSEKMKGLHALGCGEKSHSHVWSMCTGLDWVICGGESGPNARPMHPDWPRSLRDQCQTAGVPFFFKQWGEWSCSDDFFRSVSFERIRCLSAPDAKDTFLAYRVGKKKAGRLLDGREWNEFPQTGAAHVPGKGSVGDQTP